MAEFTNYTSGFVVGGETVGIEAAKITTATNGVLTAWPAAIDSTNSGSVPTVSAVASEINAKIGTVYKVKGTHTVDKNDIIDGQITNLPAAVNGDVYNIALPADVPNAKIGDQVITNGDNIVYVSEDVETPAHWDKLAGAVDTTTFATKEWVNDGSEDGSLPMQMISGAYTTSADMTADDAREDALVTNAGIQDFVHGYIDDNTLKTAAEISGIDATTSGMLVNAGAISGYIYDQIQTTIQETIDIADTLTSGMTGAVAPSAVPNASAVTGYIRNITLKNGAAMTASDANPEALVSNSAVKDYVAEQLTDSISAYAGIIVNDTSAAASGYDTFKMVDGAGVSLATVTDDDGNPTIKFNHNISISGTAGTVTDAAELTVTPTTATDGKAVNFAITVPDATTDKAGVVKADYYDDSTGLIHLF